MTPSYFESFEYVVRNIAGDPICYRGLQIGQLVIRRADPGEWHVGSRHDNRVDDVPETDWVVHHWPSGAVIATADSFAEAVQIADDVSRFARVVRAFGGDLNAATIEVLVDQLGDLMLEWIDWIGEAGYIAFREWQAQQRRSVAA